MLATRNVLLRNKHIKRYETDDGERFLDLYRLSMEYMTYAPELCETAGLDNRAHDRHTDDDVQAALQTVADIVDMIEESLDLPDDILESSMIAYAYYRGWPLVGLGNRTAAELVRDDYAEEVAEHINRIKEGRFA